MRCNKFSAKQNGYSGIYSEAIAIFIPASLREQIEFSEYLCHWHFRLSQFRVGLEFAVGE